MENPAFNLEEFCPNCGLFVESLNIKTGFCGACSLELVGVSEGEPPQTTISRLEAWLQKNADELEALMLYEQITAKDAIRKLVQNLKVYCLCCGNEIERATKDRHFLCNKQPQCKKARRYYKYLQYEKGFSKEDALEKAVNKFKQ